MPIGPQVKYTALFTLGALLLAAVLAAPFAFHWHRMRQLYPPETYVAPERHPRTDTDAFAQYAGSESCRECHREAYDLWLTSNHALAERLPDPALDEPAFVPPRRFAHGTQHSTVGGSTGAYHVATVGLSGTMETHHVARVIGHDPLRQFLVPFSDGRMQTLEASFDPHSNGWFNVYGEEDRQPGEWGHWTGRGMNWNNMCAACHNTRVRKNYDPATDAYHTTMAEMSVGCEACHGPLKAHVDWRRVHTNTVARDPTIQLLSPVQHFETCATCHARRAELTGDFVPGDRFDDHYALTLVDETDIYHADGQVRDENYEYAAFLGSRMAHAGVRCADCHEVHSAKTLLPGNLLCMRCHAPGSSWTNAPIIDPVAHSFHKVDAGYGIPDMLESLVQARLAGRSPSNQPPLASPPMEGEPPASRSRTPAAAPIPDVMALAQRERHHVWADGGECVNCHMPQTYYMQRHRRHDHGQTIPDPLLTKQFGIPNACNRCHQDQDVDWALAWTERWYGEKMDRPSRRRAQSIAAARAGEPGAGVGLLHLLTNDPNPYWQAVAAGLLRPWAESPPVAAALQAATTHSNALVRAQSVSAGEAAGPHLRKLLNDPVRAVRYAAAWALRGELRPESDAAQDLRTVLDYVADQPVGQMQNGAYALVRGDLAQAVAHYRKAVAWDPNSAPIRHDFAVALAMHEQHSEAIEQLEAACRLDPQSGEYRYKLALAWNETGRTDLVLAALREAVTLDPGHGRAWYNLGLAYAGGDALTDAADALRHAVQALPGPDAPYALATVLARQGNLTAAQAALSESLRRDPGHDPSRQLRAELSAALRTAAPATPHTRQESH